MRGDNSLRELFPSSERIGGAVSIGGSDPRGTNTIERYQNALIRYGKQSFGIYWEVFRDLEIKEDFIKPYKPSEAEKDLFNLIDSSKKIVDDFKMLRPKMTAFVLQSINPAEEEKIKDYLLRVDRIIRDLSVILYDFVLITLKLSLLSYY